MAIAAKYKVLIIMMMSSFLTPFTSSALTLSLPDIGRAYDAQPNELGWVLEIFLLASIVFLLPFGKLADRIGKRKVFLWGTILFTAASVWAVFTPSMSLLLAARALQGIGAAMVYATSMSILTLSFPAQERGLAMGWMVSMVYIGLACGPVIGGLLNYYTGWKSIFWFITLAGICCTFLTLRDLKQEWIEEKQSGFDGLGAILYGLAMILMMFGLSELANTKGAGLILVAGIFVFAVFIAWELRARQPILFLRLFLENREFSLSNLTAMMNYSATFAISFLLSMYLQSVLGLSSREAGLLMLIQPIVMSVLSPRTGRLSDRYAPSKLCSLGMGIIAAGLLGLTAVVYYHSLWLLIPVVIVVGIGFACFAAPNNNAIMSSVAPEYYGLASSMLGTVRLVGQVLSVAIVTMMLSLDWQGLAQTENLLRNIMLSFGLFTLICLLGIIPSLSRKARG